MKRVVLASASPRRRALLEALGLDIAVRASGTDEIDAGRPDEVVLANAVAKRDDVTKALNEPAIVIAADTIVVVNEFILGKPQDLDDARRMLRSLSGRGHEVYTGVAVCDTETDAAVEGVEVTRVIFRDLSDAEIEVFIDAVKPLDRAGAYTVDGPGALLVERYEGCYQNVLGLPLVRLDGLFRSLGLSLFDGVDAAKASFL